MQRQPTTCEEREENSSDQTKVDRCVCAEHPDMRPMTLSEFRQEMATWADNLEARLTQRIDEGISAMLEVIASSGLNRPPSPSISTTHPEMEELEPGLSPQGSRFATPSTPSTTPDVVGLHKPNAWAKPEDTLGPPNLEEKDGKPFWRCAVTDWVDGDPERGLMVPLSKWKAEWFTGKVNGKYAPKMYQRRLIATEYLDRCKGNDTIFYSYYPNADTQTLTSLMRAIRERYPETYKKRPSKNWQPDDREARKKIKQ
ncbi:hypothetical protein FRC02_002391 [Tulasnella sp. 418]|nr:hypothetical protein FRC02_002391 [Tulasnella sp. 418]